MSKSEEELKEIGDSSSSSSESSSSSSSSEDEVELVGNSGIAPVKVNSTENEIQVTDPILEKRKKKSWFSKRKSKKVIPKYEFKTHGPSTTSFMELNRTTAGQEQLNNKPMTRGGIARPFFASASGLVHKGNNKVLEPDDLFGLPPDFQARHAFPRFERAWEAQLKKPKPSVFKAIIQAFWMDAIGCMIFQLIYAVFTFITPIILPHLLEYLVDPNAARWKGYVYTAVVFVVTVFASIAYYNSYFLACAVGIKIRVCMIRLVYRKTLRIASTKTSNSGQIVNLVGNDAQFVADTLPGFITGVIAPLQIIIAVILMWQHVGPYALIAVAVVFIFTPVAGVLGKRFGTFRMGIQASADKRLKLTNELLAGIRIVKFYAWENAFLNNIFAARRAELAQVLGLSNNRALLIGILSNTTTVVLGLIFLFYGFFGPNKLDVTKAFSILSVVNLLRLPFFMLPFTVTLVAQYTATFNRIQSYISKPDIQESAYKTDPPVNRDNVYEVEGGEFKWDPAAERATLSSINMNIRKGELVMVVGQVGSGKSTIAATVLGDVPQTQGSRRVAGNIAYVPQEPYIINATVQENILFGEKFDEDRYVDTINRCALGPDLVQLPKGDQTEIGERGITLSGGQKQRVSIARAMYSSNKDFYVFDDPFSAVDSHVGKHLFEKSVMEALKNNGKTVFLVTNQLQYLPYADQVVVIQEGRISDIGSFNHLAATSTHLKSLLESFGQMEDVDKKEKKPEEAKKPEAAKQKADAFKAGGTTAEKVEKKETGLVSWRVYWWYVVAGNKYLFLAIMVCLSCSAGAAITASWWLTRWTDANINTSDSWHGKGTGFFIGIYVAFLAGQAIFNYISYLLFSYFGTGASWGMHELLLKRVARAPTSFFDITPLGRIINRFAKEMSLVDVLLPMQMSQYLFSVVTLLSIFAAMMFGSWYIIFAIVPMVIFYIYFQLRYRHTSVEIQRMEALSRAPIFSHLGETINGTTTIRAYNMTETFNNVNAYRVDENSAKLYSLRFCAAWFGLVLDVCGELLVASIYLAVVLTTNYSPSTLNIGYAALAITYTSGLTSVLSNLNINAVETETRMNSVERIKEYENLEQEPDDVIAENRPPPNWPSKGEIVFKDYSMAYRGNNLVLKNVDLTIKDKEKVGIVGRTGAGKSSLMQALFRFNEPATGTIFIDGIDITKIGLKDLRSKLSLIPQDPTLFIGTVRYNLDPFNESNDDDIWESLKMVQLDKAISLLPLKLDEPIAERGSNFSVGERQMICMARALLRHTKILLMDEATASVDLTTDTLIQKMVRRNFKDMTVLTIAHRLNTIMDNDKVMVLDMGRLAEFDHPGNLLDQPDGILTGMVAATGPVSAEYLRKIAKGEVTVIDVLEAEGKAELKKSSSKRSLRKSQDRKSTDRKSLDRRSSKKDGELDGKKEKKSKKERKEKKEKKEKKRKDRKEKKERKREKQSKQEDDTKLETK